MALRKGGGGGALLLSTTSSTCSHIIGIGLGLVFGSPGFKLTNVHCLCESELN